MASSIAKSAARTLGRFFGALGAMSPAYYLKPVLLNSAPLSLLVPFAVIAALRTYRRPAPILDRSGYSSSPPGNPARLPSTAAPSAPQPVPS